MSLRPCRVLFLSTGNAARSLIAEAVLNAKGSDRFVGKSAGFAPLTAVPAATLALLSGAGIPTCRLYPKSWDEYVVLGAAYPVDILVTLSEEARLYAPAFSGDPVRVHWVVDDPLGSAQPDRREWKYRKSLSTLEARISALVRARPPGSRDELMLQLKDLSMVV